MKLPINVNAEQVGAKLGEAGASAACNYCGHTGWDVLPEAAIVHQWNNIIPSPGLPIAVMICKQCGNVRMNALAFIQKIEDSGEA